MPVREQSKTASDSRSTEMKMQMLAQQQSMSGSMSQLNPNRASGKTRVDSVNNLTDSQMAQKPAKSSKNKKENRPLSGGVAKVLKQPNEVSVGKSRIATAVHNQSMYDKLGGNLQISPGPLEF